MLRHRVATAWSFAGLGLIGALAACGSAAPVDVGIEYMEAAPELPAAEEVRTPVTQPPPDDGMDSFLERNWERGPVSPFCTSSFDACGGVLAGTWQVEDSCNPQIRDPEVLQAWGQARMNLEPGVCWNAVQRLFSRWSGHMEFDGAFAIDSRVRDQSVEIELDSSCLGPTLGLDGLSSVTPAMCASLQNKSTNCALSMGVCMCTNETQSPGRVQGRYAAIGTHAIVKDGERPLEEYEYCVAGDRLLWREEPGSLRHVVLRRIAEAPPGTTDPVEIPR